MWNHVSVQEDAREDHWPDFFKTWSNTFMVKLHQKQELRQCFLRDRCQCRKFILHWLFHHWVLYALRNLSNKQRPRCFRSAWPSSVRLQCLSVTKTLHWVLEAVTGSRQWTREDNIDFYEEEVPAINFRSASNKAITSLMFAVMLCTRHNGYQTHTSGWFQHVSKSITKKILTGFYSSLVLVWWFLLGEAFNAGKLLKAQEGISLPPADNRKFSIS